MDGVATAGTAFALELYKTLSKDDRTKNLFFSPYTLSSALTMVFLGAGGSTAIQMAQVLSLDKTEEVHQGYQQLIAKIKKPGTKCSLELANKIFVEATYDFRPSYTDACEKFYHAGVEKLDFVGKPDDSRKHINSWVEDETAGKIKNMLPERVIDCLTKLVVVNAIYFKGNWASQFCPEYTKEMPFRINKNESRPVQMMYQKGKFNMGYLPDYRAKVLELPYVGNEMSMYVLLPDEIQDDSTGLEKLEREMTYENLMEWINPEMMDRTQVRVFLPKFKVEEQYDLEPVLRAMGMTEVFDKANLSGMSPSDDLVLSKVVHRAVIDVNEEGTEAAAASAAIVMMRCAMIEPEFRANHPFLFLIRENVTGAIMFSGRFAFP